MNPFRPILALMLASVPFIAARAQVVPTVNGPTYFAVVESGSALGGLCVTVGGPCITPSHGIPLNVFATSADVNTQFASVNTQFADVNSQLASMRLRLSGIDNSLRQLSAATASLHDAIPDPGDRFAIRAGWTGAGGEIAGGFSASVNLQDNLRFSVDYGHSGSQDVVSGGLNLSIH